MDIDLYMYDVGPNTGTDFVIIVMKFVEADFIVYGRYIMY